VPVWTLKSNIQSLTDRKMDALRFDKSIDQKIPVIITEYTLFKTISIKPKVHICMYIFNIVVDSHTYLSQPTVEQFLT